MVDDVEFADDFAQEKAKTTFHRVLVEQILPTFMERDTALELLEEHLTNNLLKVFPSRVVLTVDGQTILSSKSWNSSRFSVVNSSM
jgi:hypothetical protein